MRSVHISSDFLLTSLPLPHWQPNLIASFPTPLSKVSKNCTLTNIWALPAFVSKLNYYDFFWFVILGLFESDSISPRDKYWLQLGYYARVYEGYTNFINPNEFEVKLNNYCYQSTTRVYFKTNKNWGHKLWTLLLFNELFKTKQ